MDRPFRASANRQNGLAVWSGHVFGLFARSDTERRPRWVTRIGFEALRRALRGDDAADPRTSAGLPAPPAGSPRPTSSNPRSPTSLSEYVLFRRSLSDEIIQLRRLTDARLIARVALRLKNLRTELKQVEAAMRLIVAGDRAKQHCSSA